MRATLSALGGPFHFVGNSILCAKILAFFVLPNAKRFFIILASISFKYNPYTSQSAEYFAFMTLFLTLIRLSTSKSCYCGSKVFSFITYHMLSEVQPERAKPSLMMAK